VIECTKTGVRRHLTGAATFSKDVDGCAIRYVLSDELTKLCTALAYSKGASTLACADLLHVPAERVWIEWCEDPWVAELARYGFKTEPSASGRRGVLIYASSTGRCGLVRTFWTVGAGEASVFAGSMEAYFDFDASDGEEPAAPDASNSTVLCVSDDEMGKADILRRCFRFRFERTWADYYNRAALSARQAEAVAHQALGAIAPQIPVVLAFLLLLGVRPGLPRRVSDLKRLNLSRRKEGKAALLDHIEVLAPLIPEYRHEVSSGRGSGRRAPRLHHVRGHLVRRGSQLIWRVPHLRGSARAGVVRTRTVEWTLGTGDGHRTQQQEAGRPV
jgi:hypothetical protein